MYRRATARCAQSRNDLVLRPFNFCVIDEVDSILIDEARTPLIISGALLLWRVRTVCGNDIRLKQRLTA